MSLRMPSWNPACGVNIGASICETSSGIVLASITELRSDRPMPISAGTLLEKME